jgi:hypothetical protein
MRSVIRRVRWLAQDIAYVARQLLWPEKPTPKAPPVKPISTYPAASIIDADGNRKDF